MNSRQIRNIEDTFIAHISKIQEKFLRDMESRYSPNAPPRHDPERPTPTKDRRDRRQRREREEEADAAEREQREAVERERRRLERDDADREAREEADRQRQMAAYGRVKIKSLSQLRQEFAKKFDKPEPPRCVFA